MAYFTHSTTSLPRSRGPFLLRGCSCNKDPVLFLQVPHNVFRFSSFSTRLVRAVDIEAVPEKPVTSQVRTIPTVQFETGKYK